MSIFCNRIVSFQEGDGYRYVDGFCVCFRYYLECLFRNVNRKIEGNNSDDNDNINSS